MKAVRDAVPIDAVVSEYLQLRNAGGGNLKGLCPFHDEKSPSFQVSPSKGLFHCFGCQEGGDTIAFVRKIDHLSFSEAVERLAATAGITLRYEEGGYNPSHQRGERIRLVEAHKAAAQFYSEQLGSPEARDRPGLPRRARLRPGGGRPLRCGLQPGGLGPPDALSARQGLQRQGTAHLGPGPGEPPQPHRPLPGPPDVADPRRVRRGRRLRRAQAARRRQRPEVPQHPRDADLQEVAGPVRHRPGQEGHRQVQPRGRRRGLHRRHGLPPGRRHHRDRHLRHRLRRRPHQDPSPAADGQRLGPRDLHLRRRRGRPEGGPARLRGRPEVRRRDLHRDRARQHGPLRSAPGQGRRGGRRAGPAPHPALRVRASARS